MLRLAKRDYCVISFENCTYRQRKIALNFTIPRSMGERVFSSFLDKRLQFSSLKLVCLAVCTGRRRRSTRAASSSTCARSPSTTRPSGCSPSWRRSCWSPTWTASPTSSPPSMTSWTRTGRPSSGSSSALQVLLLVVVVYSTVRHPSVVTTAGHNRYGTGIWPGYRMIIKAGASVRIIGKISLISPVLVCCNVVLYIIFHYFSVTSVAPSSNNSLSSVLSQPSLPPAQPTLGSRQRRHLLTNRPRSFDAGLAARQIKIGTAAAPARRAAKSTRPVSAKKRAAAAVVARAASIAAAAAHKSPRKNILLARRNLRFDKSPRYSNSINSMKVKSLYMLDLLLSCV